MRCVGPGDWLSWGVQRRPVRSATGVRLTPSRLRRHLYLLILYTCKMKCAGRRCALRLVHTHHTTINDQRKPMSRARLRAWKRTSEYFLPELQTSPHTSGVAQTPRRHANQRPVAERRQGQLNLQLLPTKQPAMDIIDLCTSDEEENVPIHGFSKRSGSRVFCCVGQAQGERPARNRAIRTIRRRQRYRGDTSASSIGRHQVE